MGAGWYRKAYYPPEALIDRRPVDDLADVIVREFHEGVGATGIRPGIIGEIGTDNTLQLRAFGGNGYTYLQETYLPRLRAAGVPDDAIDRMTVENPRRVLSLS